MQSVRDRMSKYTQGGASADLTSGGPDRKTAKDFRANGESFSPGAATIPSVAPPSDAPPASSPAPAPAASSPPSGGMLSSPQRSPDEVRRDQMAAQRQERIKIEQAASADPELKALNVKQGRLLAGGDYAGSQSVYQQFLDLRKQKYGF